MTQEPAKNALCLVALLFGLQTSLTSLRWCDNWNEYQFQAQMDIVFSSLSGSVQSQQHVREFNRRREHAWLGKNNVFKTPVCFGREIWSLLSNKLCCSLDCEQNTRSQSLGLSAHQSHIFAYLQVLKGWAHSFLRINCWVRLRGLENAI